MELIDNFEKECDGHQCEQEVPASSSRILSHLNLPDNLLNKKSPKGFKYKWLVEFKFLRFDQDREKMFCAVCTKHEGKIKKTGTDKKGLSQGNPKKGNFIDGSDNFSSGSSTISDHKTVTYSSLLNQIFCINKILFSNLSIALGCII